MLSRYKLNKGELIEAVAKDVGISKALAGRALDSTIGTITKGLSKGEQIVKGDVGSKATYELGHWKQSLGAALKLEDRCQALQMNGGQARQKNGGQAYILHDPRWASFPKTKKKTWGSRLHF